LESVTLNVKECTYDSAVFRINIYKQSADGNDFVNILTRPIYTNIEKTAYTDNGIVSVTVDVSEYGIEVEGNTLVSFEHIDSDSSGELFFPVGLMMGDPSYIRESSQDTWERADGNMGNDTVDEDSAAMSRMKVNFPIEVTARVER
jgi:hypothetical protein